MMSFLAIPGMLLRLFLGLCLFLMTRPGGWAVVCCLGIAATWYIKA